MCESRAQAQRPTFSIVTLGCKVNQYDGQAIRESLSRAGYREVAFGLPCDVSIINTCTVTAQARRKSHKHIYQAARTNPHSAVLVTGCLAEVEPDKIAAIPGVTRAVPRSLAGSLPEILRGEGVEHGSVFDLRISSFAEHTRAFLKVQDGCDGSCAYCIVPRARGPARSRDLQDARSEAERLIASGFREIVLCGIHLGAYGKDLDWRVRLEDLIEAFLPLAGLERLRLSSIEVNEVTDRLIGLMVQEPRLCPHLHIPLQSGDDFILRAMNRRYTAAEYLVTIERVRARVENPSFTTDVLAGFPGESEEQFEKTLLLCRAVGFSRMHVFPFSARPGTPAATLRGRVRDCAIRQRDARAREVAQELALEYKKQFVGKRVSPLVEHQRDGRSGKLCGRTERYLQVIFDGPDNLMGRIVPVRAAHATPEALHGCAENP